VDGVLFFNAVVLSGIIIVFIRVYLVSTDDDWRVGGGGGVVVVRIK
jgi:hypothetical protein